MNTFRDTLELGVITGLGAGLFFLMMTALLLHR
jgi:hypothetical protein